MLLQKCKINQHNRVKILCSNCGSFNHESDTYADLDDKAFTYYCLICVGHMVIDLGQNLKFNDE